MKINKNKFLILIITNSLFLSLAPSIILADNYGAAGCGLGSLVTKKNTKLDQLFAVSLNVIVSGTWGQISSITSGTSGCNSSEITVREKEQIIFVAENYTSLRQEMATGKGEKLEAFIDLMGCSNVSSTFTNMTQKKHSELFRIKREESNKFIQLVKTNIKSDSNLAKSCQYKA